MQQMSEIALIEDIASGSLSGLGIGIILMFLHCFGENPLSRNLLYIFTKVYFPMSGKFLIIENEISSHPGAVSLDFTLF